MPKLDRIKCPICGTEMKDELFVPCPYCEWAYVGIEEVLEEDERDDFNLMSLKEARALFKKGLTKWGDPLPKKKPK